MSDYEKMIPSMFSVKEPSTELRNLLEELGFKITFMQHKLDVFDYKSKMNYKSESAEM